MASLSAPYPSPRVYPKWRALDVASLLLSLLPLAYLIRICIRHSTDVPFWDEWEMVPRFDHLASGTLSFYDFWRQQNEHRPLVPVATMLVLGRLSGWNIAWEVGANVLLGAAITAVFWAYTRAAWREHGGAPLWLMPCVSLLVLSPVQWENWTWGFQMVVLMCALASTAGAYLIARSAARPTAFAGAIACAMSATYSFGSGVLLWFVQPAGLFLSRSPSRRRQLMIWTVAGLCTCATFFYDYHRPPHPSLLSNFASLAATKLFAAYFLTFVGAPIGWYSQRAAATIGLAGVAVFVVLCAVLWRHRHAPIYLFPGLIGFQTLASAGASAAGRAWMGVDQALSSRYTTHSTPLWCAVVCLAAFWVRAARPRLPLRAVTAALLIAMLASAGVSAREGVRIAAGRNETLRFARRGLIVGKSNAMLLMLYPNLDQVRAYRATLLRLRLSVFRPTAQPTYPRPLD